MKLAPPILLLSTTTAFAPHSFTPLRNGVSFYEQRGGIKDAPGENVVGQTNGEAPSETDALLDYAHGAFNIGEMPRMQDETSKKKRIARVSSIAMTRMLAEVFTTRMVILSVRFYLYMFDWFTCTL